MGYINDGGQAFPHLSTRFNDVTHDYEIDAHVEGMSLRDYFAAKAMQAAITTSAAPFMFRDKAIEPRICEMAYGIADAMLKAREVQP